MCSNCVQTDWERCSLQKLVHQVVITMQQLPFFHISNTSNCLLQLSLKRLWSLKEPRVGSGVPLLTEWRHTGHGFGNWVSSSLDSVSTWCRNAVNLLRFSSSTAHNPDKMRITIPGQNNTVLGKALFWTLNKKIFIKIFWRMHNFNLTCGRENNSRQRCSNPNPQKLWLC